MLKAPFFAQSHQCKNFLGYVVLQTLSGNASELKERTIGISAFGRANDYDTGETSIVRVTANEVRKRIGQYYRDSRVAHPIELIELEPQGSLCAGVQIAWSLENLARPIRDHQLKVACY